MTSTWGGSFFMAGGGVSGTVVRFLGRGLVNFRPRAALGRRAVVDGVCRVFDALSREGGVCGDMC